MNIILVGLQNSGKTTVGETLAHALQYNFLDSDRLIEQAYQTHYNDRLTVREIYKFLGRSAFSDLETSVIEQLKSQKQAVIATGGGIILSPKNTMILQSLGIIIYLRITLETFEKRIKKPAYLEAENTSAKEVYQERIHLYQSISEFALDCDQMTPTVASSCIQRHIGEIENYGQ